MKARTPPPLCVVKAAPDCEVVGGMFAKKDGRMVRACVPCAGTLFGPYVDGRRGDYDGHTDTDTDTDTESTRLEHALGRVVHLERRLALADRLVALYDAAMYDEGSARADADALLLEYERAGR